MTFRNALIGGFSAIALMMSAIPGYAQEEAADATATEAPERTPEENWLKVCEDVPPAEEGEESTERACIMRQVVLANGQFLGSFVLRMNPTEETRLQAVAAVPLGVLLPFQLKWQIDGGRPVTVPFMTCDTQSCVTWLAINEAYVNSLKAGAELKLIAKNRSGEDLMIRINLAGFTSVYESEDALSFDEFNDIETGVSALERQLQDRAEALRREQEAAAEGGDAEAPAEGDGATEVAPAE